MARAATASVTHITFATPAYYRAAENLAQSANRFGIKDFRLYTPDHPAVRAARADNPTIMKASRGAGYWLWKPYIILDAMRELDDGRLVIYTDADHFYVTDPSPLIAFANKRDITLFHHSNKRLTQARYTKRDCFVLLDADRSAEWRRRQLEAGIQVYRNGGRTRGFVEEWREAMRDHRVLTDSPNSCGLPDLAGFVAHRHDQSVLTIIAARNHVDTYRKPTFEPTPGEPASPYPRVFGSYTGPVRPRLWPPLPWLHWRLRRSWSKLKGDRSLR